MTKTKQVCVSCSKELSQHDIHEMEGFCPKCGHDSESLVCKTHTVTYKLSIFGKKIGQDSFSIDWLRNN